MTPKSLFLSGVCAIALSAPAFSEDLGVILTNLSYRTQPDLASGPGVDRIERALREAGFATVTMQNMSHSKAADRLASIRDRLADADRLVVIVNGHMATSHGRSWLLAPEAKRPTDFTVGSMGLPLAPFVEAASNRQGAGLIAIMDQRRLPRVGVGVTPGYIPSDLPQGVSVLTGDVVSMANLFEGGLLDGSVPMAEALDSHDDVSAAGFVSAVGSFMPTPVVESAAPEADTDEVISEGTIIQEPQAPEPTPEELMAGIEKNLGLSRENRRRVQRSLAILGFDPRGIDGLFGPGSRRAIRGYQADRGYGATGYLTRPVLAQLFEEADARSAQLEEEARQRQAEAEARDTAYWRSTGQGRDEAGMRAYLERFPDGQFSQLARNRLQAIEDARRPIVSRSEQRAWNQALAADDKDGYEDYLTLYPNGAYRDDAEFRLAELEDARAQRKAIKRYEAEERNVAGNSVARRLVENRLARLGLEPGPVDGEFDEDTRRALRRYQEARGLEVTGYVNQATMVRVLVGN